MATDLIEQAKATCERTECTGSVFARLCGISEPRLSKILNGREELTTERRVKMAKALTFIIMLQESSKLLPVCFHSFKRLEALWDAFNRNLTP